MSETITGEKTKLSYDDVADFVANSLREALEKQLSDLGKIAPADPSIFNNRYGHTHSSSLSPVGTIGPGVLKTPIVANPNISNTTQHYSSVSPINHLNIELTLDKNNDLELTRPSSPILKRIPLFIGSTLSQYREINIAGGIQEIPIYKGDCLDPTFKKTTLIGKAEVYYHKNKKDILADFEFKSFNDFNYYASLQLIDHEFCVFLNKYGPIINPTKTIQQIVDIRNKGKNDTNLECYFCEGETVPLFHMDRYCKTCQK